MSHYSHACTQKSQMQFNMKISRFCFRSAAFSKVINHNSICFFFQFVTIIKHPSVVGVVMLSGIVFNEQNNALSRKQCLGDHVHLSFNKTLEELLGWH
jgi:hypothetical protein